MFCPVCWLILSNDTLHFITCLLWLKLWYCISNIVVPVDSSTELDSVNDDIVENDDDAESDDDCAQLKNSNSGQGMIT